MPSEEQTYRTFLEKRLDRQDASLERIETKVTYTNGKVRKIIVALVLVAGIVVGQTFGNWHDIIGLLANAV